jgi:hypothetical protein
MNLCSGKQGASALIYTGACCLKAVLFTGDTAKEPTLTVEDNVTSVGTNVKYFGMVSDECHSLYVEFPDGGLPCDNGIYATLSAAEGDYIIYYEYR